MNKIMVAILAFVISTVLYCEPVEIHIKPLKVAIFPGLLSENAITIDGPGFEKTWPVPESNGGFFIATVDSILQYYDPVFRLRGEVSIDSSGFSTGSHIVISSKIIVGLINQWAIDILKYKDKTTFKRLFVDKDLEFMTVIDNYFIYRKWHGDYSKPEYTGYALDDNLELKRYPHAEVIQYAIKNIPGMKEENGQLKYYENILRSFVNNYDDDHNMYTGGPNINGKRIIIYSNLDQYILFDSEGNAWQFDYYDPVSKNPVLYYAGRDWGYKEPAKKAKVTDDGLRIRLRATTDGFILGKLDKGQSITVLKTGEKATINGLTAPWYRIKTADGMIGWVFGGYVELVK